MADDVGQRQVAGLWCLDVLALLPERLDDELDDVVKAQVDAHLQGCDWCEQFGGAYAVMVRQLRASQEPMPEGASERLTRRLADDLD